MNINPVPAPRPAVFLDRDGTLIEEVGYLDDPGRLRLLPGVAEGLRLLNEAGVPAVVVTNQAGVGRGYFPEAVVGATHDRLVETLARQGARVDGFYHCPHHPDDGCDCRKPRPGLLVRAAVERGLDLPRSVMIGDKRSDLLAGRAAGCRAILVLTGYGAEHVEACQNPDDRPDLVAADLPEAVRWALRHVVEPASPSGSATLDIGLDDGG